MCSSSSLLFPLVDNGQAMYNLKPLFGEGQSGRQQPLVQHSSEILLTRHCERPFPDHWGGDLVRHRVLSERNSPVPHSP